MFTTTKIYEGDALDILKKMPDESVHCVVTSPPYWGLRDYDNAGQIGLEEDPALYIVRLVQVFRQVRRVLRRDGTVWLNLGDSYSKSTTGRKDKKKGKLSGQGKHREYRGLPSKNLMGIPWRVALALQRDGWYLRSDIIWSKPSPLPESVKDRPTKSHEYVFLLAKSQFYHYDQKAICEPVSESTKQRLAQNIGQENGTFRVHGGEKHMKPVGNSETRNRRSVWNIATVGWSGPHFAVFPPELPKVCIKAGCPAGGTVLDPFGGAGTTSLVASRLGRNSILIELNKQYVDLAAGRVRNDAPMFNQVETIYKPVYLLQAPVGDGYPAVQAARLQRNFR